MHRPFTVFHAASLSCVLLFASGCNPLNSLEEAKQQAEAKAKESMTANDLKVLSMLYLDYHDAKRQGPAGWNEVLDYCQQTNMPTAPIERLRDAGYEVQWGVRFADLKDGMSNTVLAEKSGGPTLMFDGVVRTGGGKP